MNRYDIIGDIHGCAEELKTLLGELDYRPDDSGVYRHPGRTAVFVGDLIDRGEGQLEVLRIVKAMVEQGGAKIVMGNHEFNAVAHSMGLRDKSAEFFELPEREREHYLEWFLTIPLWLDLDGLRVIHACWHEESMDVVRRVCGSEWLRTREHYAEARRKGSDLYRAVETLLKGPEISLTALGCEPYRDHGGTMRTDARVRWWDRDARTVRELADVRGVTLEDETPYPTLPDVPAPDFDLSVLYTDNVPVIYGHYWFDWDSHHEDWTAYTACVDFSAIRGGRLIAYRWDGESTITWKKYHPHTKDVVAEEPSD